MDVYWCIHGVPDVRPLAGGVDQLEAQRPLGDVPRLQGLLGHNPHVASLGHVQGSRVTENHLAVRFTRHKQTNKQTKQNK